MKRTLIVLALSLSTFATLVHAESNRVTLTPNGYSRNLYGAYPQTVQVQGYQKKDGTTVAPYSRTHANSSKQDNWSTKGNVNPITGKRGSKRLSDLNN